MGKPNDIMVLFIRLLRSSIGKLFFLMPLYSIRSLINTITNERPHERMVNYQQKSATGYSLPSWLSEPGKVLLKQFLKNLKYESDVTEVELLEGNPQYAYIK